MVGVLGALLGFWSATRTWITVDVAASSVQIPQIVIDGAKAAGSVTAMGDVVNTASRLQTAAAPGEVLVGPATHGATHHTIAYEARGLVAAKGRDEPVETWVAAVGRTSVTLHQIIRADGEAAAEVESVVVSFDYGAQRPTPWSDAARAALAEWQAG